MARDVYVVGSVNLDLVVRAATLPGPGETVTGGTFERHGGGKSANQAVAAARQGATVRMVGAVGSDDLGDEAVADLAGEGVDVSAIARVTAPTGVALIAVDEAGENQIAVASGANNELTPEAVEAALAGAEPGGVRADRARGAGRAGAGRRARGAARPICRSSSTPPRRGRCPTSCSRSVRC